MNYIPALIETLRSKLQPWRAYVIAIDGRDGVGKSPLGRKLAFDLHVPLVETDLFLVPENSEPIYRVECLSSVIASRLDFKRPVIVEGIFLLRLLRELDVIPNFMIHVSSEGCDGSNVWAENFAEYESEFDPAQADHHVRWKGYEQENRYR